METPPCRPPFPADCTAAPHPQSLTYPLGPRRHFWFPRLSFLQVTASTRKERKKERKMKLVKLVLLISKDPVWVSYRKSNTVTRATPTLPLSPIFKQRLSSSHSEISVKGVRFRPICGINKCRLLGKCAPAPCLISPPSHGCAELNNLTSG